MERKIYLCASFLKKPEMADLAGHFRSLGWEVVSTWHDRPEEENCPYSDAEWAAFAERDLQEIEACNSFFSFQGWGSRGGRHTELGFAVERMRLRGGIEIHCFGKREHLFHFLPGVFFHADLLSFLREVSPTPGMGFQFEKINTLLFPKG